MEKRRGFLIGKQRKPRRIPILPLASHAAARCGATTYARLESIITCTHARTDRPISNVDIDAMTARGKGRDGGAAQTTSLERDSPILDQHGKESRLLDGALPWSARG